ncbi:MAG: HAMP domain-containing histidine kinase [Chitinophagaceae bacterium]|nr:HAMP domain-containing histidine kinase [Chitinophagaceae bacterium]
MKLFTKYNRVNITATIFVFVIGSIGFYLVLHYVLVKQLDDSLRAEQQEITGFVTQHNELPFIQNTRHQWIEIKPSAAPAIAARPHTVFLYNAREDESEPVRQLVFPIKANGAFYTVTVNKSETETEELLKLIILVTVSMIFLTLLFNYFINRRLIRRLWQPFYNTIAAIRDYRLQQPLKLRHEPIEEIGLLNDSLNAMTERINRDYLALRSLTENASHEMQTPLAVIHLKVESLLQTMERDERSVQQLMAIEDATQKLSKLHQSLLLLTKLENRQFLPNEQVNLTAVIQSWLEEKREMLGSKNIGLIVDCDQVVLPFHQHLAEILVGNLLNNAIRYTPAGGSIKITLSTKQLVITNSAANGSLDTEKLFQRFYKAGDSTEGTGLGLAIVQEICLLAGFHISYHYTASKHAFTIRFS